MQAKQKVADIDAQIVKLLHARYVLMGEDFDATPKQRGHPKGSTKKAVPVKARTPMSAEVKARIVLAQKKRWAAVKKAKRLAAKNV